MVFYKPGFCLNDCVVFAGDNARSLLVCNEADVAQGEVIGHISVMEVSRRGISRWRLLCWYDNAGSDMSQIVSVVPTGMRRLELDDGLARLQVKLKIVEGNREAYEKGSVTPERAINLVFQRKGQRYLVLAPSSRAGATRLSS